ncbi:MAG: adenylosuccinate synthetase [Lachnospiraceae bacterium]
MWPLTKYEEERLGKAGFGSTKSGIAPFYGDKYLKIGVQVCQLYDEDMLRARLSSAVEQKNATLRNLYHKPEIDLEARSLTWRAGRAGSL